MRFYKLYEKGGDEEVHRFKKALKMAKAGIEEACEIAEDMEDEFSDYGERGRYGERSRSRGYYGREWDDMDERRSRDSRGRYM